MELHRTTLIPIIRTRTKTMVGAYNLGRFAGFTGAETTFTLPSGKVLTVQQWTPNSANQTSVKGVNGTVRAKWHMAVVIDETAFAAKSHMGYAEYVDINTLADSTRFTSASGAPNQVSYTPGTLFDMMSPKSTCNQPPICNVDPVVGGSTAAAGTATVTNGTWVGSTPTYTYQWMLETGVGAGTFSAVGGATTNSWVITASNTGKKLYCAVTATDTDGARTQPSTQVTLT